MDLAPFLTKIRDHTLIYTLSHGVGYLHEGLSSQEQEVVAELFNVGAIHVCVASSSMCWGMTLTGHLVVVMGTQYYDGRESAHTDYPITDLLQMMGRASRPQIDSSGKFVILCHAPRKEYYKRFLSEPYPIETNLDHFLHDHLNAEVAVRTIENKQDAVDYLTWTFMYRRLTQNPNYYNLHGVSPRHLSDHLSELVEETVTELEASLCVTIEGQMDLSPLLLGIIATVYYVKHKTIELFSSRLTDNTDLKGLVEILASALDHSRLPMRPGEGDVIQELIKQQRFVMDYRETINPHLKAHALIQAHFSRQEVTGNLASFQREVLLNASRLTREIVLIITSSGWLNPALTAMKLCQMVTQGLWEEDELLLQLPHLRTIDIRRLQEHPVSPVGNILDLLQMEVLQRRKVLATCGEVLAIGGEVLAIGRDEFRDTIRAIYRYPNVSLQVKILNKDNTSPGSTVTLQVTVVEHISRGRLVHQDSQRLKRKDGG